MSSQSFRAFVSYCHADQPFAARLQRRLEAYRLPRRLADRVAPLKGQAPGRIGPVFRDRADLSAAVDLSEAVREAIAASSALVVVTSPDAVKSQWVDREIQLFRALHPAAPILVAHARGEPAEAMPAALLSGGSEPLAADFRREGDGYRLAFLKIVGGLSGLPLDALVQRDAQRQIRRVTAVTLGAGALVVVMGLLLVVALRAQVETERQRAEVERQRAGAEGLVEFMLTTLREEMKGTGRPKVMAAVDARALAYYSGQGDLTKLPDASLERRARALHAMGEDEERLGNLPGAFARFLEARRTTAALLAKRPHDPETIFTHAQSEYWVGYFARRKGDAAMARRYWQGYRQQAAALAAVQPGSIRSLVEQGYAEGGLCDLALLEFQDTTAAAKYCSAATQFLKAALEKNPADPKMRQDLANRYGWMARVQLAEGKYTEAIASRMIERNLMDQLLASDPQNVEYLMRRAWPDIGTAEVFIKSGRASDAVKLLIPRWNIFKLRMNSEISNQYWETGLRMIFFLNKACRDVGGGCLQRSSRESENFIREYNEFFPGRSDKIIKLQNGIG